MKPINLEQILKALVEIPSVTGELESAKKVIAATKNVLNGTGMVLAEGEVNRYPYLQATTRKPNKNMLWIVSHLDVVPAEEQMFNLTSDAANYYGRGVFDMKGMAAAALSATLKTTGLKDANLGLLFTTDEETGGKNGVGALVDQNFKAGVAFVFDQSADWVLQERMKGILWLEIASKGQAAHGARPWLGHNANQQIVDYLYELKTWYGSNIQTDAPDNYYTTFNLGTVHGGGATNQVSSEASATIDIRFTNEQDAAKITEIAKAIAKHFKDISVKEIMHEPCVNTDTSEKWFRKTEAIMNDLRIQPGSQGERFGHGSTDGRFFAPLNIPVISTRPPGGGQHGAKEWVSKNGLLDMEKLCVELIKTSVSY
jgi:succinyl-diaminopimelate desuccinylase